MERRQVWTDEELGQSLEELTMVISDYEKEGIQGIKSRSALKNYMKGLSCAAAMQMYAIDEEATLQMTADLFGIKQAAKSYMKAVAFEGVREAFTGTFDMLLEDWVSQSEDELEQRRSNSNYSLLYKIDTVLKELAEEAKQEEAPVYEKDRETDSYIRLSSAVEIVKRGIENG